MKGKVDLPTVWGAKHSKTETRENDKSAELEVHLSQYAVATTLNQDQQRVFCRVDNILCIIQKFECSLTDFTHDQSEGMQNKTDYVNERLVAC